MAETNLMRRIMLRLSEIAGVVCFRNNVGFGWSGRVLKHDRIKNTVLLADASPIKFGLIKGSGDLIGWRIVTVTPDMVGQRVALFLSVEVKDVKGRADPAQQHFMRTINEAGGIAGIVRSPDEAASLIESRLL